MSESEKWAEIDFQTAKLGIETEAFVRSNLWRYMKERADMEIEQGKNELLACLPGDIQQHEQIRNKVLIAKSVIHWVNEVIQSGHMAAERLREDDINDV
jgi:hypothetical protein